MYGTEQVRQPELFHFGMFLMCCILYIRPMNFLITGTGEGGGGVYLVQRVVEDPGRAVFFLFFFIFIF